MGQEVNSTQDYRQEVQKVVGNTTPIQLAAHETAVLIPGDYTQTIKLPPVAKMKGKMVTVKKVAGAGSNTTTIDDYGDDPKFAGATIATDNTGKAFYSDGYFWYILA